MRITAQNIAVLDANKDGLLSCWVEEQGRLDHDMSLPEHYLKYINSGDVVVDGGAAIGDHTIAYLRAVGPTGVVHAFEPNPLMLDCLKYNCKTAIIHPFALSDSDGVGHLLHNDENAGASFLTSDGSGILIKTIRLDSFDMKRVEFIKLDLEGYEKKAILGARETLLRCRPRMVIEVNPAVMARAGSSIQELFALLDSLQYGWSVEMGAMPTATEGLAEMYCYPR